MRCTSYSNKKCFRTLGVPLLLWLVLVAGGSKSFAFFLTYFFLSLSNTPEAFPVGWMRSISQILYYSPLTTRTLALARGGMVFSIWGTPRTIFCRNNYYCTRSLTPNSKDCRPHKSIQLARDYVYMTSYKLKVFVEFMVSKIEVRTSFPSHPCSTS